MKKKIIAGIITISMLFGMMVTSVSNVGATSGINLVDANVTPAVSAEPYAGTGVIDSAVGKETIKILAIGNSFSQDAFYYFPNILEECSDVEFICGMAYIGGTSFENHWTNIENNSASYTYEKSDQRTKYSQKLETVVQEEEWDYIVMQQLSDLSGLPDSTRPYFANIISFLQENCPTAELVYQETWAYQSTATFASYINNYSSNQETMYSMVHSTVKEVCDENGVNYIIPVGTAVQFARRYQNATEEFEKDTGEFTGDGKHLNMNGKYLNALTWFECFTGIDARTVSFKPNDVKDEMAKVLKRCAHIAVAGGDYMNPGEDPAVMVPDVSTEEMVAVGEPVYKFDFETDDQKNVLENLWGLNFEVAPTIVKTAAYEGTSSLYMKSGAWPLAISKKGKMYVEPGTDYILKFQYKGGLFQYIPYMNDTNMSMETVASPNQHGNATKWTEVIYNFKTYRNTGDGAFGFKVQLNGSGELWIDNIELYKAMPKSMVTPTPEVTITPEVTTAPEVTVTPTSKVTSGPEVDTSATPSVNTTPSAEPTVTPKPAKVTVKFTKKKVTIKKGKKKVLKVKIKGAKKAKFSVNKKGKKIVKLMKKKAKKVTVRGMKKGKATITAKVGKKKAICKVTVK